jgi:hypothetical protein
MSKTFWIVTYTSYDRYDGINQNKPKGFKSKEEGVVYVEKILDKFYKEYVKDCKAYPDYRNIETRKQWARWFAPRHRRGNAYGWYHEEFDWVIDKIVVK